jgi:hypothetical protein
MTHSDANDPLRTFSPGSRRQTQQLVSVDSAETRRSVTARVVGGRERTIACRSKFRELFDSGCDARLRAVQLARCLQDITLFDYGLEDQ